MVISHSGPPLRLHVGIMLETREHDLEPGEHSAVKCIELIDAAENGPPAFVHDATQGKLGGDDPSAPCGAIDGPRATSSGLALVNLKDPCGDEGLLAQHSTKPAWTQSLLRLAGVASACVSPKRRRMRQSSRLAYWD